MRHEGAIHFDGIDRKLQHKGQRRVTDILHGQALGNLELEQRSGYSRNLQPDFGVWAIVSGSAAEALIRDSSIQWTAATRHDAGATLIQ